MRISDWSSDVCSSDLGLSKAKRSTLAARSRYGQDEAWRRPKKPKNQLPDEQGGPLDKPRKHFRGKFSVSPAMSSLPTDSVRSEERRVGKEGVSTGRCRGAPYPETQNSRWKYNRTTARTKR